MNCGFCFLFLIVYIVVSLPSSQMAFATIINIPDDYSTIQAGIDASTDGDTVLVQPDTYVENINFSGHNIVLGSLFLTTEDTSYISQTIIDGDSSGSVVTFESGEDSTAIITGFTIINGYSEYGGGISCYNSHPRILNNLIAYNITELGGAGIECYVADPVIAYNIIKENSCLQTGSEGGGIYCNGASPHILENRILSNSAYYGGGIFCRIESNTLIENNLIKSNCRDGIYFHLSNASIIGNQIIENENIGIYGKYSSIVIESNFISKNGESGIFLNRSDALVKNNIVCTHHLDDYGGAIIFRFSDGLIINNTISQNFYEYRGGIYCALSSPTIKNNLIWGNSYSISWNDSVPEISYCNLQYYHEGEGNISMNPLFIDPGNSNFNICYSSPCIDAGDPAILDPDGTRSDIGAYFPDHYDCFNGEIIHVSVFGSDSTGDGSEQNPYQTVQNGINQALHGDTVIVGNGVYFENVNMFGKLITLGSEYIHSFNETDIYNTVIDGDSIASAVKINSGEDSLTNIIGFRIRNGAHAGIWCVGSHPNILSNIIEGNYGERGGGIHIVSSNSRIAHNILRDNYVTGSFAYGAAIYNFDSDTKISNNKIYGNIASSNNGGWGAGIYINRSNATVNNNIFYSNIAQGRNQSFPGRGGALALTTQSYPMVINNVFYGNQAGTGGAMYIYNNSTPVIINSILWQNTALYSEDEIRLSYASVEITYSSITGGWEGEGNLNIDPLFRDPENDDFHLMATYCGDPYNSPCIDAGHPDSLDVILDCDWGLGSIRADMGAYGGGDSLTTGISPLEEKLPQSYIIAFNYPNPFNSSTNIFYNLPISGEVKIDIFDILGRKVQRLLSNYENAGEHKISWNSEGFSSGIYFYKISVEEITAVNKFVLMK